ncbi:MAG: pyridoxal phosphate-dependent aminotransferase [Bacteroides sp.]|nr:pyridoxal phosphate-dependent aminotransferase [Bacteroides sp.]MCM1085987.1 pyridoxal phosphate-dependent aminotransferase [Bacteroides sp.]MCM1168591.1 pyridoxal phosphate-dependent aminotransferase [Bacteroides sp.]MCM1531031.1 pyridoxal phosphate-dependent aminotransferase [Ruminococcus flavefaciens]MCM1554975.1 pyridoxal phosphate-dependent aminotransferase [Bacteroides sp.]
MATLSKRVLEMAPSATLGMSKRSRSMQEQGIDVVNLSVGEPDFDTPRVIKDAGVSAIENNFTHYPPVPGYLDLRKAICTKLLRDNKLTYSPDQIVVGNGGKHAIMNVLMAMINPGDEVVIPAPCWVSYPEMVKFTEGTPVLVPAGIEDNFKITPAKLEAAITPRTKLVIFNSPSNPTGMVYNREELKALADVLAKHPQVYILSDEIYELITFEGKFESLSQFEEIRDRIIIINGVSKGFAMTGWRIGYIAAPTEIAAACNKIQGQMTSAASSIAQKASVAALLQDPQKSEELKSMVATFRKRRDMMLELLREIPGLKVNVPTGAFYIFPNIEQLIGKKFNGKEITCGDDLANFLLDEAHVALVGGDSFGDPKSIRISYATSEDKLRESAKRIKEAVAKLQ